MKRQGLAGLLLLTLPVFFQLLPAHAAPLSINEVQSGLLAQDSLTTGNTAYWYFYGDAQLVYSSSSLNRQMPSPFNSYLEVQSTYASGMLSAKYNDYYSTVSSVVQVQNAPPGDTAQVIDSKSNVLASATVGSGGVALLEVGQYHLPITGYVQVYDTAHNLVATTSGTGAIWGGDVYRVGTTTTTTSATSSSATTTTSSSTTLTTTTTATSTTSPASSS